jgi:hypothetical protein
MILFNNGRSFNNRVNKNNLLSDIINRESNDDYIDKLGEIFYSFDDDNDFESVKLRMIVDIIETVTGKCTDKDMVFVNEMYDSFNYFQILEKWIIVQGNYRNEQF